MAIARGKAPANYRDPPPGKMGWGKKSETLARIRSVEKRMLDQVACRVLAKEATPAGQMLPKVEAKIRAKFQFDEGWDFTVAELMVYKAVLTFLQNIGNCVGASHVMLVAARIAHEILADGDAEEPLGQGDLAMPFAAYSYGVGRWAGNMLGGGDGSYCGAQIQGTQEHGFLPCFTPGLEIYSELPQGTATVGRLFGRSLTEIKKWTAKALPFDLLEAPVCTSADDCKLLVVEKKIPLQICSGQGFAFWKVDPTTGINLYRPSGSWSHSIQIVACFAIKGRWFVKVRNQWGVDAHRDGMTFTITLEDFARWIKSAECIGIGQIQGLPSNPGF